MNAETELAYAKSRLQAWIRDYGHEKQPEFIADLKAVLATPPAPPAGEQLEGELAGVTKLARRAYPGLKRSGFCSKHRDGGHYECSVCYPDWQALIQEHMAVRDKFHDQAKAAESQLTAANEEIARLTKELAPFQPMSIEEAEAEIAAVEAEMEAKGVEPISDEQVEHMVKMTTDAEYRAEHYDSLYKRQWQISRGLQSEIAALKDKVAELEAKLL